VVYTCVFNTLGLPEPLAQTICERDEKDALGVCVPGGCSREYSGKGEAVDWRWRRSHATGARVANPTVTRFGACGPFTSPQRRPPPPDMPSAKHKPEKIHTSNDPASSSSSSSRHALSSTSALDIVSRTLLAPFQHRKTDSSKILADRPCQL
jgi:hypothetical protein